MKVGILSQFSYKTSLYAPLCLGWNHDTNEPTRSHRRSLSRTLGYSHDFHTKYHRYPHDFHTISHSTWMESRHDQARKNMRGCTRDAQGRRGGTRDAQGRRGGTRDAQGRRGFAPPLCVPCASTPFFVPPLCIRASLVHPLCIHIFLGSLRAHVN